MTPGTTGRRVPGTTFALVMVRAVAAWVIAGALFKLLAGTPADLPSVLRDLPVPLGLQYRTAISIELAVVALAIFAPRVAWLLEAAMLAVFVAILVALVARGDANCGCFGSSVSVPPAAMLAIDGTLLAALLASRPWRIPAGAGRSLVRVAALGAPLGAGIAAPWALARAARGAPGPGAAVPGSPMLPAYAVLTPAEWIGKPVEKTSIGRWLDLAALPKTGLYVIYRMTCEHCGKHLFELAAADDGTRPIVLVRIVDKGEDPARFAVEVKPAGAHVTEVTLPESVDWVVTTPAEFELADGVVTRAQEGEQGAAGH